MQLTIQVLKAPFGVDETMKQNILYPRHKKTSDWGKFTRFFNKYSVNKKKHHLPAFNFCNYQFNDDGYTTRKYVNIKSISALILDYDDGYTIESFQNKYNHLHYYLYTSASHTVTKHKYRVIIPLEKSLLSKQLFDYAPELIEYFKGCDECTFARGRFFFMPTVNDSDGNKTIKINNVGSEFFSIENQNFKGRPVITPSKKQNTISDVDIQLMDKVISEMSPLPYSLKRYAVANALMCGTQYAISTLWSMLSRSVDSAPCPCENDLMDFVSEANLGYFVNLSGGGKQWHKMKLDLLMES